MLKTCKMVVPVNKQKLQNLTVYGAIGKALRGPIFMLAKSTNHRALKIFARQLKCTLRNPYKQQKPWLVLDNHTSHHTKSVHKLLEDQFHVLYQPPYSSAFNCQETVWSVVKREYFARMYRRDSNLTTQLEYGKFLLSVCHDVPLNTTNLLRANREYIEKHLRLRSGRFGDIYMQDEDAEAQ